MKLTAPADSFYRSFSESNNSLSNLTLQELCDEYLEEKKYRVRESTYEKTKRNLDFYVISKIGNIKVKNLNLPLMQKWKMSINKMGLKNRTKQNAYAEFRALINYAVKMEYIPSNPLTKLGNFVDANEMPEEMKYYTVEEFHKFIAAARKNAEKTNSQYAQSKCRSRSLPHLTSILSAAKALTAFIWSNIFAAVQEY